MGMATFVLMLFLCVACAWDLHVFTGTKAEVKQFEERLVANLTQSSATSISPLNGHYLSLVLAICMYFSISF
ncbi:hypothetical protein Ciccas_010872 [Cichlidogyrus casuarinus]|uniref:Uncharacterized protein n=1 Tax=Cichlidogyrus casuarinus TaxID=1844966 RepID=A0ABD2PSU9_9PLAT